MNSFQGIKNYSNCKVFRAIAVAAALLLVTGCLLHPRYVSEVKSLTQQVPFILYTLYDDVAVTVECDSNRGGYVPVATFYPGSGPIVDAFGRTIFEARKNISIPAVCWHKSSVPFNNTQNWHSLFKITQGGYDDHVYVFNDFGFDCLTKSITDGPLSWFRWISRKCYLYGSGNTPVRKVFVVANDIPL